MDPAVMIDGLFWFLAFLFSTTIHEAMHAWEHQSGNRLSQTPEFEAARQEDWDDLRRYERESGPGEAFADTAVHYYYDIPGIVRARRFESLSPEESGARSYLTIYEFESEPALRKGLDVMNSRADWKKLWKEWEGRAVSSISDGLFRTSTHVPGPRA